MAIKYHKHWILLYLNQIILKKMEEKLLNLNQLHRRWGRTTGLLFNIFVKFISLTSINIVLQTVAGNYKKYNFFLDFFNRIWYNIFEDKGKCNESFRLKSRTISFKQDIAKQKIKLIWKVAGNCTNLLHELVEVFSTPCLKVKTF